MQIFAAPTVAWFLLIAAPRTMLDLWGHRRRARTRTSDADVLGRLTHLPAAVWNAFFIAVTAARRGPAPGGSARTTWVLDRGVFTPDSELPTGGRTGVITTPHGDIRTPAFIPVGTRAAVRAVLPEQMADLGAQAVLANAYHLYLQPGADIVETRAGWARS